MARLPIPPLEPGWLIIDGLPVYHRSCTTAQTSAPPVVHVHGFAISGTYLEPTASILAGSYKTYVPDLPGMGRSMRPPQGLDVPGLVGALLSYCDAMGIERACFVGNSLGCPLLCELATTHPDRMSSAVLVSPAGGPNNQPMPRAVRQMLQDGLREPPSLLPIAVNDYLHFGFGRSWSLFKAMTAYDTLAALRHLTMPTLVIAGRRDPLINFDRAFVLSGLPHLRAVTVSKAHALNFSSPQVISALIDAHLTGGPLVTETGPLSEVEEVVIPSVGQ